MLENKFPYRASKLLFWTPLVFSIIRQGTMASTYTSGTHSLAFVTVPDENVAKKIARGLVENKLAACVNIIPSVTSVYMWKGEINEDSELILKIKTRTSLVDQLTEFVKKNHPYEVCEVVTTQIDKGNTAYLNWISEVLPEAPSSCTTENKQNDSVN